MLDKEALRIIAGNEPYKKILAEYDKTHEFALDKIRRSFTIEKRTYWKLKQMAKEKGTSMSALIDGLVCETLD